MSQEAQTKECFCNRSKGPYVKDVEGENRYEQSIANGTFSSETVALFSDIDKKYHNYRDPINIATFMNDLKDVFEKQGLSNFKLECTPCRTVDLSEITLVPNEGTVVYNGIEYTSANWLSKEGKGVHSLEVVLSVCAGRYSSDTMCTVTLTYDASIEKQETDSAYLFDSIAGLSIRLMEKALKIKKVCQKII
jgi:hypothetical protein